MPPIATETEPLPRCCESHGDWTTLATHLIDDFTEIPARDVVAQVSGAKQVVNRFGLSTGEQLEVGELMARHQLMVASGRIPDVARLDPEIHVRSGRQGA
jgi:hypothetical protein